MLIAQRGKRNYQQVFLYHLKTALTAVALQPFSQTFATFIGSLYLTICKPNTFGLNILQRCHFPRIFACGTVVLQPVGTSLPLKNLCFDVSMEEWPTLRSCIYFCETSVCVLLLRKIMVCFSADFSVLNSFGGKL